MRVNYDATVNILDSLHYFKSKATIHIPGSGEEYGEQTEEELPITAASVLRPVNPYAVTKIAQDLISYVYHKSYGINVIRTRAFNHEGPRRENVFGIASFAYQIAMIEAGLQAPTIKTGHLDDRRNFTHVRDMVEAYWISTEKCKPGKLYLVGSESEDKIFTFREALEQLIKMSSYSGINHEQDNQFVRPTNVPYLIADISEFRSITGWEPKISFQQILEDTLNYWRQRIANG
jgi:GDP-4-dehydro-6-deoxy-D-mannose reductase